MQYYSLHDAVTKIGRGGYPQVQSFSLDEGRKTSDPDFVWNLKAGAIPNFKPYIGTLNLQKGSAVTDFISHVLGTDFICNEKARNIIKEHSIGVTDFYDLKIKHKDTFYDNYKLMHSVNNYTDKIDFEKSVFHLQKIENNVKVGEEKFSIANLEEFREYTDKFKRLNLQERRWVTPIEIRFKENYQPEHDIFIIWGININTYVSEKLKTALEKNKVTGVRFDIRDEHIHFG